jgi:hypothetical protein
VIGSRTVVCYAQESSEDSRFAQRLIDDLCDAGVDVVTCENRQGIAMEESVIAKLQESQWVILVQTPAAHRSPQVQLTIDIALNLASQQRMRGVLSMIAVPHSLQDIPSTWTTLKTFDASEDYPKALARLLLTLNPVLSASMPSIQMRAAPPPAFQPMMAESPEPEMEPDDKPARFMPLWLRKKQLKSWLVPLSAVLALVLVAGVSMEVFAMITHAHAQPVVAKKPVATMSVRVVTQPPVPTPTPNIAPTPTPVPTQLPVVAQPPMPTPTPNIATIAQTLYQNVMQRQPTLTDPLNAQDGNNWDNTTGATGGCELLSNGYSVSALATGSTEIWAYCLEHSTSFSNFAYQVQMTYGVLNAPSPCGLVFRAHGTDMHSSYRLYFGEDGSYELDGYQGTSLINGNGVPINANTNQANTLTVIAKNNDIYIYANNQFIAHVADNAGTSGSIGMVCKAPSGAISQAGFQFAKIWTI